MKLMSKASCIVGNSSSGIIEVPSLKKGVINFGVRQQSRSQNKSIINTKINCNEIKKAITKLYSRKYQKILRKTKNDYEKKNTSDNIFNFLIKCNLKQSNNKKFYNGKY